MSARPTNPPAATTLDAVGHPPGVDPARLAGLLATYWLEVRCGRRPLAQLRPVLAPAVVRRLRVVLRRQHGRGPAPDLRVRRVLASQPTNEVCEAVVLVDGGGRTTAVAVRLERRRGRWLVVDLSAPEDGLPALPPRIERRATPVLIPT